VTCCRGSQPCVTNLSQNHQLLRKKGNKGLAYNRLTPCFCYGTRDENRTRTDLRPRDFKSLASTSSATRALGLYLSYSVDSVNFYR
jgi:hypothetical protein